MTDEERLEHFIGKYSPQIAGIARSALNKMRQHLSGAVEFVYERAGSLVIGFGPNERVSDAPFSIVLYARWVRLFFLNGASLPDPHGILEGSGSKVRSIKLAGADDLEDEPVRELIARELERTPIDGSRCRRLLIRSGTRRSASQAGRK